MYQRTYRTKEWLHYYPPSSRSSVFSRKPPLFHRRSLLYYILTVRNLWIAVLIILGCISIFFLNQMEALNEGRLINNCKEILNTDPTNVACWLKLGDLYYKKSTKTDKKDDQKNLKLHESRPVITGESSLVLDKAIECYKTALKLKTITVNTKSNASDPVISKLYYQLGRTYFKRAKDATGLYYKEAKKAFFQAINAGIENAQIHTYLGHISFYEGQYNVAIEEYKKVTKKLPEECAGWFNLAWTYKEGGMNIDAINTFDKLLTLKKNSKKVQFDAHLIKGELYYKIGLLTDAKREYQSALKIDSSSVESHNGLVNIYKSEGEEELAKAEFEKIQKIINKQ